MRDQTDCTYPHTRLCVHPCGDTCVKRGKAPLNLREIEDQQAEDEEFRRVLKSAQKFSRVPKSPQECQHMRLCIDYPSHCPNCPSNNA